MVRSAPAAGDLCANGLIRACPDQKFGNDPFILAQ
jgi:hypothetical protein